MEQFTQSTTTLSIRVPLDIKNQLEDLAAATQRSKSFLAAEAIQNYIELQAWQVKSIQEAIAKIDSGKAKFASHEAVGAWINSLGTKNELEPPECK